MPARERPSPTGAVRSYYRAILPFYEEEVASRRDLPFWAGLCRRWKPRAILEVGCGLGLVTEAVAAIAPAVGIDLSIRMLRRAHERLRRTRARVLAADVRHLSLARRFDLVIAPGDPFCHWTRARDRRAALRAIARQLTPDGRFVLDGLHRRSGESRPVAEHRIGRDGRYLLRESWKPAGPRDVWIVRYEYRRASAGSRPEAAATLRVRSWDVGQIARTFRSAGLVVEQIWGDFRRRPFRRGSGRVLVVARRRRS